MVSIKSIVIIALASFAVASPMFGESHGDSHKEDVQGKEFDGKHGKEGDNGGEFNWLDDLLKNKDDSTSWEDNKSIQNQQCGNEQSVVACCNKGASDSKGLIAGTILGEIGGPCSTIGDVGVLQVIHDLGNLFLPLFSLRVHINNLVDVSSKSKQCGSQKQVACCAPNERVVSNPQDWNKDP